MKIARILGWFRTAPRVKSNDVLNLERANKVLVLFEAIEDAKKNRVGKSKDGRLTVRRVN